MTQIPKIEDESLVTDADGNVQVIKLYEKEEKIHARSFSGGYFTKWRWAMVWATQIFFYGAPWLIISDRQGLLFDLANRHFYIFNFVLYPQDLIYLTFLLIISALSLFLFTAVAGRLWCGYTCPQTVYTEIFMWMEELVEGSRAQRIKLDAAPFSLHKLYKKATKHFLWIAFSLWTGFTFVGYFTPIRELLTNVLQFSVSAGLLFWMLFYALATYGNAGFLREQVCKYMCPYARFQSAMFDDDTLVVTYDAARGEPRGAGSRKASLEKTKDLGSCVDCSMCVQVCPTGIDIRDGLQYECIGCGVCADVCDDVMDKVGQERGLIKYSTQNAMDNGWDKGSMIKRVLRPRVLIYSTVLLLLVAGLVFSLINRAPFKVDIVRDRSVMARIVEGGLLENVYRIQIMNATEDTHQYQIGVRGLSGLELVLDKKQKDQLIELESTEAKWVVVNLHLPDGATDYGSHDIEFVVKEVDSGTIVTEEAIFLVPR